MLAFYLLLSAALLSGFQAIATSAQSGHGKLRQTTRDEIVKRSSRTQPKRATISNGLTCTQFYLQTVPEGTYVYKIFSNGVDFLFTDGVVPSLKFRVLAGVLYDVDTNDYVGSVPSANNPTSDSVVLNSGDPIFCFTGVGGALRCRRDSIVPTNPDTESWGSNGLALTIGPTATVLSPVFLKAVCA